MRGSGMWRTVLTVAGVAAVVGATGTFHDRKGAMPW